MKKMTVMNEKGLSLVEVLIAMTIFAIGMLALAQMQITSMGGNVTARDVTEASSLAQSKIEELSLLPYGNAALADSDSTGDAGFGTAGLDDEDTDADGSQTGVTVYGTSYDLFWNVAVDSPATNTKTVRVIVRWQKQLRTKRVVLDYIRADGGI